MSSDDTIGDVKNKEIVLSKSVIRKLLRTDPAKLDELVEKIKRQARLDDIESTP